MQEAIIRPFETRDRSLVRDLSWETAFVGKPADAFFSGKETLATFLTGYFTDHEPASCFVSEVEGRVVGYLIGAKDTVALDEVFIQKIIPRSFAYALQEGVFLKKRNLIIFWNLLRSLVSGQFSRPSFAGEYPATLHINVKDGFRNQGIGAKLIATYIQYLRQEQIRGVYLATMSEAAGGFFTRQGFRILYKGKRSYFSHLLNQDLPLYIFGRKL